MDEDLRPRFRLFPLRITKNLPVFAALATSAELSPRRSPRASLMDPKEGDYVRFKHIGVETTGTVIKRSGPHIRVQPKDGGATLWKELSELLPLASAVNEASEVAELQRLFSSGPSSARANAWSARGVRAAAKQTVSERPNKIGMPKPAAGPLRSAPPEMKRELFDEAALQPPHRTAMGPAQENAFLDDGDDTNLDGIDDNVAVAAQAAQVAEAEAEAKSSGERLAGMMRVRGGMGAGASALTVESSDADIKAAYEGASAQERSVFLVEVGEQEKRKLVSLGLDVPVAAPSGLTPGASALSESHTLGQLSVPPTLDLKPHDFRELWREKKSAHLQGTREWAFAEILKWLDDPASPQLFWLMGGGGTGKSVLTAELLDRVINRTVAWHFCRHDNPAQSAPGSLLRSLAAMLAHRLPGYKEKLEATGLPGEAVDDPAELFTALFETPLLVSKVQAPERPLLIILDALDELPKESQKPLLAVIASQLSRLPPWLKLFVTSREEPQIRRVLSSFTPKELRADEAKNRADVEVYLRTIARQHIKGEASIADIEADVKRTYGIDMKGKLAVLQKPMEMSKAIYAKVREKVSAEEGYKKLIAVPEKRNADLVQVSDDLHTVHVKQAPEAQEKLELLIADKWEADPNKATLRHPVQGTARAWVEFADSPGIKKEPRVSEKMKNDYGGHANKLKDLARLTLRFTSCSRMADALAEGLKGAGIEVLTLKNKYASPTPMGYSDFNSCAGVVLSDGTRYVCEIQLNHVDMLEAKKEAHVHYEKVREELPALCQDTKVDAGELEAFIVGRLSTSSLDAAVEALSAKAEGLFLYAYMLGQHLESEAKKGHEIHFENLDSLPAGLGEVYAVNFKRAFPEGQVDPAWTAAKPLVELIAAAREPITVAMAAALLRWDDGQQERVLETTALLFPVRDDKVHVFHKTIVDWLTGEITEGSSIREPSAEFKVQRKDGHAMLAEGFIAWRRTATPPEGRAPDDEATYYWLRHGILHLCRADGQGAKAAFAAQAAHVYATDLALLRERIDRGLLSSVAKDYLELRGVDGVDLTDATEMRQFVGKYMDVLQRDKGAAVMQLALQQPDASAVFRAAALQLSSKQPTRVLMWRNKSQEKDACIGTLSHKEEVSSVAVGSTRIVSGSGNSIFVYDTESQELIEEIQGTSRVQSVAIWDDGKDGDKVTNQSKSLIVAGFEDGTIKVWDSGAPRALKSRLLGQI